MTTATQIQNERTSADENGCNGNQHRFHFGRNNNLCIKSSDKDSTKCYSLQQSPLRNPGSESNKEERPGILPLNDDSFPVPQVSFQLASVAVLSVATLCFLVTGGGGFQFDDHTAVLMNKDIQTNVSSWHEILLHDFWGTPIQSNLSHKSYRPLTVLTYRIDFGLAGGHNSVWFHIVNIVLHAVSSLVMLHLFTSILDDSTKHKSLNKDGLRFEDNVKSKSFFCLPKASLFSGTLFAVHPVHTENVAALVGRADILCSLFYASAILSYTHGLLKNSSGGSLSANMFISVVCTFNAMMCKEQGITALGVCIAYDAIMHCKFDLKLLQYWSLKEEKKSQLIQFLKRSAILFVMALLMLCLRFRLMGSAAPSFQYGDNPASFQETMLLRLVNYLYIYSINALILVIPIWLCFDWSMGCVPVITAFTDPRVIVVVAFVSLIVVFLYRIVSRMNQVYERTCLMSFCLLIIPFLPSMNILFRVGFVVAERNLYLPSIGFVLLVTAGYSKLETACKDYSKLAMKYALWMMIVSFAMKSIQRSLQWNSALTLYTTGIDVCPLNAKVHYNIGKTYSSLGDSDSAIIYYKHSIKLAPNYDQPLNNLGNIYKDNKDFDSAEDVLTRAIKINPNFAAAWMNLGTVKAEMKKYKEAEQSYRQATLHRRQYPDAYYNWGNMYLDMKNYNEAMKKFEMAISQRKNHHRAWNNKIMLLGDTEQCQRLPSIYKQVVQLFPDDWYIYYVLGNSYGRCKMLKKAETCLLRAHTLNPQDSNICGNLGVLYHQLQAYTQAEKYYQQSTKLNPENQYAKDNLRKLRRTMEKMKRT